MFDQLTPRDPDAIIALMGQARADTRPGKMDLGVGVYKNTDGDTPIMRAVVKAQARWMEEEDTKLYMGTTGSAEFCRALAAEVLGEDHPALATDRVAVAQGAGGSGALRLGAELIREAHPDAKVWVSTPTWPNHTPLIGSTGLEMRSYPYYDRETLGVDFDAMMACLREEARPGDVVVLHGCCHNPTGADLTEAQWDQVAALLAARDLLPFVDLAYLGLGRGWREDAYGVLRCIESCPEVLVSVSCSKNFALYRERVGIIMAVCESADAARVAHSHFGAIQRKLISMPPAWGANVVSTILADRELRHDWREELEGMRARIRRLRRSLSDELDVQGGDTVSAAIRDQQGMFSTLPLSADQAVALREGAGIYITNSGRMNIAGASLDDIPRLAEELLKVL